MGGGLVADTSQTHPDSQGCSKPERTLVLVGRTRTGKSATGNSILGATKFELKRSAKAITKECELQNTKLPTGLVVNVIDTPGLFSASSTMGFTSRELVRCLSLARDGIDAVLLVFSLRTRLTEKKQSTLHTLKTLFGSQITDYIIVVFTNADVLDEYGQTLENYLQDRRQFQEILKECDDRKVLFDNRRNVPARKKEKQVQDLLNLVKQISKRNRSKPYMTDLSLELRENEDMFRQLQKQIETMKGFSSKQDTLEVLEKSHRKMLERIEKKVSNQFKESLTLREVKKQLWKAEAAREAAEQLSKEEAAREAAEQLSKAEAAREAAEQLSKAEAAREAAEQLWKAEAAREAAEQLSKAEAARKAAEKTMNKSKKLSADEIKELRNQLDKAMKETAQLREKVNDKDCTIL